MKVTVSSMSDTPQSPATPSLIDTEQMNESERALVEAFERRSGQSPVDETALASAEELAEPTGTPGSTADATAAPGAPTTVEGLSGAPVSEPSPSSESVDEPVVTEPTVEGEATGAEPAQSTPAFTFAGVDYGPEDLAQAVQVRNWYQTLNNQQIASIDAMLSGQYRLVPAHEADPVVAPASQTQPPASATAPASSPSPVVDEAGEWLDPHAQAAITRLETELAQMREQFQGAVTPIIQTQAEQELQARRTVIASATETFQSEYSLTDDQMQALGQAVVQANIFPSLIQRHNNDIASATRAALDMMLWSTPTFRDPVIQQRAAADLQRLTDESAANVTKQKQMTALTSSGGSVPRREAAPSNKDDRHAAMVELIRADMNGS